jgi:hypothetical protein
MPDGKMGDNLYGFSSLETNIVAIFQNRTAKDWGIPL